MLGWDWYGFHEECARTHSAKCVFLHPVGSTGHVVHFMRPGPEMLTHYFLCSGGTGRIPEKARWETLHKTCFFQCSGFYGSCCAFVCVWDAKY
jgi:hypothetical protein